MKQMRIAVVCYQPVYSGGFIRFIRFGMEAKALGHEIIFVYFNQSWCVGTGGPDLSDFKVCSIVEAEKEKWDAVMIPGAGFPETMLHSLARLLNPNFGQRVQHVLNDQSKRRQFIKVNQAIRPHFVVFNNKAAWPERSLSQFMADAIYFLEGAVDCKRFAIPRNRLHPSIDEPITVGALTYKNPEPLIEAVRNYPNPVRLKLFGSISPELESRCIDLVHQDKVVLVGPLDDYQLPQFYQGVDCIVHMDLHAGWANLAAEAMASGVPLICTHHGTEAFARDGESALLLHAINSDAIIEHLHTIHANKDGLVQTLTHAANQSIQAFTWEQYSKDLLDLIQQTKSKFYTRAPDLGLHGKWSIETRLDGLEPILESCKEKAMLDLGAAECILAEKFMQAGAASIDCVEKNRDYFFSAKRVLASYPSANIYSADLSPWHKFLSDNQSWLRESYDIVLFLGVYHHLPKSERKAVLLGAASLAREQFVVRTPDCFFIDEDINGLLKKAGLSYSSITVDNTARNSGGLHIMKRT